LKTSRLVNDVQNSWFSNMGKYSCVNHRINEICRFTGAIRPGGHSVNSQTLPISSQTTPLNNICSNSASASVIPEYSLGIPIRPHPGNCGRSLVGCPDVTYTTSQIIIRPGCYLSATTCCGTVRSDRKCIHPLPITVETVIVTWSLALALARGAVPSRGLSTKRHDNDPTAGRPVLRKIFLYKCDLCCFGIPSLSHILLKLASRPTKI
jgi:hypothetical protein